MVSLESRIVPPNNFMAKSIRSELSDKIFSNNASISVWTILRMIALFSAEDTAGTEETAGADDCFCHSALSTVISSRKADTAAADNWREDKEDAVVLERSTA